MKDRPMRRDANGNLIPLGSKVADVKEIDIDSSGWTAVSLSSGEGCKYLMCGTRDGENWKLSATDDGDTDGYMTMTSSIGLDIVGREGETLFWVKGTSDTILEVIIVD